MEPIKPPVPGQPPPEPIIPCAVPAEPIEGEDAALDTHERGLDSAE